MRDEIRGRKIAVFSPYVSGFVYTASGGISQMKLGNGRWETAKFNTRNQVTELGLGTNATDASLWKVNYDYGELNPDGSLDLAKNTGNIARQTLTFNGLASPLVQSYRYDSLYRITEAKEMASGVQNWVQNWEYDRYGNRTAFTQDIAGVTTAPNPPVDPLTNRFAVGQGFTYDSNGNVVSDVDPVTAQMRGFVFNGDNKQSEVRDANGVAIAKYFYDGEGKRVKKITDTETTVFVYSAGKLIAEYSTQISQTPSVSYLTSDHLGSPRLVTDELGQVRARRDFMPFGEELSVNIGARSAALKYGTNEDGVRQKFTGYERDAETDLDFAQARMYENRHGRFTAIDPLLASGKSANPQTFNRYSYTSNNPIIRVDRTGKDWYMIKTVWLGYNGRQTNVWTPVWDSRIRPDLDHWNRGAVFRAGKGPHKGAWITLDPWSKNWTVSKSRAEANKVLENYRSQMKQNALGGAVSAVADFVDGNINPVLRPIVGSPTKSATDSAMHSAGINPDESSEVHGTYHRMTTAAIIASSVAVPEAVGAMRGGSVASSSEEAGSYLINKAFRAPKQVSPGTTVLEGEYVNDIGNGVTRVEPWRAHYDDYGRIIGRTDFNAGNSAAGIPDTHYHCWAYDAEFPFGIQTADHAPGVFVP